MDPIMSNPDLPHHYRVAARTLVRFACVMTVVGLLSGVLFQESAKKLPPGAVDAGLHTKATLRLALVHGHVIITAVLIPIACAAALLIARRIGGAELGTKSLGWLTRGYLPLLCISMSLMLIKAYHVLLSVRGGELDLAAIDARFFFGQTMLRHAVYGLSHFGMALSLCVFFIALWRSLAVPSK
jgi:hypothetical protein